MTTETKTLEHLQAEIPDLKAHREAEAEMAKAQRELEDLKAGRATVGDRAAAAEQIADLKVARVRQGLCGLSHFLCAPVASVVYGAKTGYWMPTLAATGVAVIAVPVALVDLGFTLTVAPSLTSCLMMCNKSSETRRKLGILMPEQADAMMAEVTHF